MNFKEYSIRRKNGKKEILLSIILYILATVLAFFSALTLLAIGFGQLAALAILVSYYLAYRFSTSMKKEFEYAFVEDQVTIDEIMNRTRRKRLIAFTMKDVEIIAPVENSENAHYLKKQYDKVIDATSRGKHSTIYFAVINKEKRTLLKFEPIRSVLMDLYKYAPSKIEIGE